MRLDLRFSNRPIEDLWCQALLALVLQRPGLVRGRLSGLNEKMTGFLTHLEESGFWTAKKGETLLLASQNRIKADKVLLKGLGGRDEYNTPLMGDQVREASAIFDRIDVREFGIHIPMVEGFEEEYPAQLDLASRQMVSPFLENHQKEPDFLLKVIFSVEKCTTDILNPVAARLREYFLPLLEFSIVIRLEGEM